MVGEERGAEGGGLGVLSGCDGAEFQECKVVEGEGGRGGGYAGYEDGVGVGGEVRDGDGL